MINHCAKGQADRTLLNGNLFPEEEEVNGQSQIAQHYFVGPL